jgi:Domain of unknown function (DUF4142)
LNSIALQVNATFPTGLLRSGHATYDRLSKLFGLDFDEAYANDMGSDHEADVAEFKRESTNGQNDTFMACRVHASIITGNDFINGYAVCYAPPEWLVTFHTGYKLDRSDFRDVRAFMRTIWDRTSR